MGFENISLIVASHLVLIAICILFTARAIRTEDRMRSIRSLDKGLLAALSVLVCALAVERAYYVAARLLLGSGYNLWAMHPAPEVLSLIVATGIYAPMVPMLLAKTHSPVGVFRRIVLEIMCLAGLWFLIVWWLY